MTLLERFMCGSSKSHSSNIYEDDIVYPVHALDDTKTFRSLLFAWTIRFNDVLDADKLCFALRRLLEIEDWRKIGGRLRLKNDGKLEIHVPRTFTKERRPFSYSHEHFNEDIENHNLAKDFPRPDGNVSIWPSPQSFQTFGARPGAPTSLKDLLSGDTPQISLHITTFMNATFVAIVWPHTLMDMIGQQAFLTAWSLVLARQEFALPAVLGARKDVLCAILDETEGGPTEYCLRSKQLRGISLIEFGMRLAWDMLCGPTPETRIICLSKWAMDSLRLQAQTDLTTSTDGKDASFISHNDVLVAWIVRAVATSIPKARPVTALHAVNARYRLPALINAPGVYLQNMVVTAWTLLSPELAIGPLGQIALINRQCLNEQGTEAQVLANLQEQRRTTDPSKLFFGPSDSQLILFTDWTKAKLLHALNFSPAVVRTGDTSNARSNPSGTPIYHHAFPMQQSRQPRLMAVILDKDYNGSYWLMLTIPPNAWIKLKESLQRLQE